ncbi:hypothetical protein [Myroides odoratimimus]|uniref:hypothetical protein n=1 Tax=Myroides odoratimimus TaxID=76832 RepID=UPI0029C0DD86|nr:hypothetical protein [Myroides odoratimimus]MDX4974034.1 hypothetical protein [Myroides odoratimimus]
MGFLSKLFGKKENKPSSTNASTVAPVYIDLSEEQKKALKQSTLPLRTGQLYMHYWEEDLLAEDYDNVDWAHRVVHFWEAEEVFEKKSLPLPFLDLEEKLFLFKGDLTNIEFEIGKALPWSGFPGGATKYTTYLNEQLISIPQLSTYGNIDYIERVPLTEHNLDVLTEGNDHLLLLDERIVQYNKGEFFLDNTIVPIDIAYSTGGLHLVRKIMT